MRRRSLSLALAVAACIAAASHVQASYQEEAGRLAAVLHWQPGNVVAEIGAGSGQLTLAAAQRVGETGHVYTTELDPKKLAHLKELAAKEKNISTVQAAVTETNLPPACCDSIFMRLVYHHLTRPPEIDASLFRSLKPGGLLAVIDMEPRTGSTRVEGVPENRGGHGIPRKILIQELTSAGFQLVKVHDNWQDDTYCVVFRKPSP